MASRLELLELADSRGILPDRTKRVFDVAKKRGLIDQLKSALTERRAVDKTADVTRATKERFLGGLESVKEGIPKLLDPNPVKGFGEGGIPEILGGAAEMMFAPIDALANEIGKEKGLDLGLGKQGQEALGLAAEILSPSPDFDKIGRFVPLMAGAIKAFHGSPHKFKTFDLNKVGTGEGVQAFGHGLYFTEEKDIANWYAKKLSRKRGRGDTIDFQYVSFGDRLEASGIVKKTTAKLRGTDDADEIQAVGEFIEAEAFETTVGFRDAINMGDIDDFSHKGLIKYQENEVQLRIKEIEEWKRMPEQELEARYGAYIDRSKPLSPQLENARMGAIKQVKEQVEVENIIADMIREDSVLPVGDQVFKFPDSGGHSPNVYSVTIHKGKTPDQYDYIPWEKPLSKEQSNKIKAKYPDINIAEKEVAVADDALGLTHSVFDDQIDMQFHVTDNFHAYSATFGKDPEIDELVGFMEAENIELRNRLKGIFVEREGDEAMKKMGFDPNPELTESGRANARRRIKRNKLAIQAAKDGKLSVEDIPTEGGIVYSLMEDQLGSPAKASEALLEAGIDGVKYPTGSLSGIKGSEDFNFVVFDPNAITIEAVTNPRGK